MANTMKLLTKTRHKIKEDISPETLAVIAVNFLAQKGYSCKSESERFECALKDAYALFLDAKDYLYFQYRSKR